MFTHGSGHAADFVALPVITLLVCQLLLLVDRAIDLATAVGHTSTYQVSHGPRAGPRAGASRVILYWPRCCVFQALVDDMLGVKSNRVSVQVEESGRTSSTKYDLDSDADAFWRTHRGTHPPPSPDTHTRTVVFDWLTHTDVCGWSGSPFPEAIAANGEELAQVSAKEEEVRKKTGESTEDAEAEAALIAR